MVVTLIPGYGTGGGANDMVVAEVGKDAVTLREVQSQVQSAMRNRSFPAELASVYVPMMVDQMIAEKAMAYEATRLGFDISEAELAAALKMALPQLFPGGQFVGKEAYAGFLAQQNMTIPEFEARFKQQMLVMRLRTLVSEGVIVTPQEVEQEFRRRNEKIKLEYVAVSPEKMKSQVTVTPGDIMAYYEGNKASFKTPEKRNVQLLIADEAKIGAAITVPEAELRRLYDQNKEQYRTPDRVNVRHILLKTTDKPKEDVPKIQAKAEDLLKQIKGGANFAELAKKNSEDPGSAVKGGDLGWVARGQTVKNFEDTAFSLQANQISNVIKTEYGFHIIQVMQKENARLKPFEEMKDQIAQEIKRQQVFETMQRSADQAHDLLQKQPNQVAQIAQQLNLQVVAADNIAAGQALPEIGASPELQDAIASLPKGGVSPVAQAGQNKLVVALVTDVISSRPSELSEVEAGIRQTLTNMKATQLVLQRVREVLQKAQAGGDLQAAAKSLGLEVKTTQEFSLTGAADGIGQAALVGEGFTKNAGAVFGPVASGEQQFVCKVVSKAPADMTKLAQDREAIQFELKDRLARERSSMFEDALVQKLTQDGKVKKHEPVIKRLVANYRG
jgi:peptidyl-prolyl cis-trans isomerase D